MMGYIVLNESGPLTLCHVGDGPTYGLLMHASSRGTPHATVFRKRGGAQRAIKRSMKYAESNGLTWGKDYTIVLLES